MILHNSVMYFHYYICVDSFLQPSIWLWVTLALVDDGVHYPPCMRHVSVLAYLTEGRNSDINCM